MIHAENELGLTELIKPERHKAMSLSADDILWQIYENNLLIKDLSKEQVEILENEFGPNWKQDIDLN